MKRRKSKKPSKVSFLKQGAVRLGRVALLTVLFAVSTISVVLVADMAHMKYIENYLGESSVFIMNAPDSKFRGSGTAFQVKAPSGKEYLLTNAHICELKNDKDIVMVYDKKHSKRLVPKRVIEVYSKHDLCLIEPMEDYRALSVADSLSIGEPVTAIGYPLGEALNISKGRVKDFSYVYLISNKSPEECTAENEKVQRINFFFFQADVCIVKYMSVQTDLVIYGGNSGSPVVDIFGRVVAVVFAGNTRTNWGSAVPLEFVKEFLKGY